MAFEAHCIVEIMGHQVIAGKVSEETHFGSPLMRVDVPTSTKREGFTVYYGGNSIYKIAPTTEEIVKAFVEKQDPEPVKPYMLALPSLATKVEDDPYHSKHYDPGADDYEDDVYYDHAYVSSGESDPWDDEDDDEILPDDDVIDDEDAPEYYADGQPTDDSKLDVAGYPSRARIAQTAKSLLEGCVIFDLETTGFDSDDEIIQIAAIDQDGHVLLNQFIKPTVSIDNSQYHGITDEMVKDAPSFTDLYPQIKLALGGKVVLAYNYDYDSRMLDQVCRRHKLDRIAPIQSDCVMLLYADYYGEWDSFHGNNRWQKLNKAVARFGLEFDGKEHDALADAKMTLAVLRKMAGHEEQAQKQT